jgi:DNA excision repair protein ERCC-4
VKYLDTIVAAHSPPPGSNKHNYSPWLFLDAAHVLFQTAKSRVYEGKLNNELTRPNSYSTNFSSELNPALEELPKWSVLSDVLGEIEHDAYLHPQSMDQSNSTILIMCNDQRICRQLREYIGTMHAKIAQSDSKENDDSDEKPSGEVMMRRRLRDYLNWKRSLSNVNRVTRSPERASRATSSKQTSSSAWRWCGYFCFRACPE